MLIYLNGITKEITPTSTLQTLIEQLDLNKDTFAIAVNECFVSRSQYAATELQQQDNVEVVSAMQGG